MDIPNLVNSGVQDTTTSENIDFDITSSEILGIQVQFVNENEVKLIHP